MQGSIKFFQSPLPETGRIFNETEKKIISMYPSQKVGRDTPVYDKT